MGPMQSLVVKLQLSYDTPYCIRSQLFLPQPVLLSLIPPCPPSTTYSLSLYIFIDEVWQRPNSNIAGDIWYAHPTLNNKKRKEKM